MSRIHSQSMQKTIHKCVSQIFEMRKEILKMVDDPDSNLKTYCEQE